MKVAILTDTHVGVRNDAKAFLDSFERFSAWFLTYVNDPASGIEHVFHLGDLVDRRKYVSYLTASRLHTTFLSKLGVPMDIIAGNHDEYFREDHSINALRVLVTDKYPNVTVRSVPGETFVTGSPILMMPWITKSTYEQSMAIIGATKAQVVFGHLELTGFEWQRGILSSDKMDPKLFDKFDVVASGHYHHKSTKGNIHYLGATGEYTWADFDDPRGFHVYDSGTRKLSFVQNPETMFAKYIYDDTKNDLPNILKALESDQFKDKMLKVIVREKTNPYWFDQAIARVEESGTADLQVVEDHLNLDAVSDEDIGDVGDTMDVFRDYIDKLDLKVDRKRLDEVVNILYKEAMDTGVYQEVYG